MTRDEIKVEWRDGWGYYGGIDVDWSEWTLLPAIAIRVPIGVSRYARKWGIAFQFGPLCASACWEFEQQLWEDGKPTGGAISSAR